MKTPPAADSDRRETKIRYNGSQTLERGLYFGMRKESRSVWRLGYGKIWRRRRPPTPLVRLGIERNDAVARVESAVQPL